MKATVLVVDNNPDFLELAKVILQNAGYDVITCRDELIALEILKTLRAPDLIILEFHLNRMNGLEFLEQLEWQCPEILKAVPVRFITCWPVPKNDRVRKVLTKPFRNRELIQFVQESLKVPALTQ